MLKSLLCFSSFYIVLLLQPQMQMPLTSKLSTEDVKHLRNWGNWTWPLRMSKDVQHWNLKTRLFWRLSGDSELRSNKRLDFPYCRLVDQSFKANIINWNMHILHHKNIVLYAFNKPSSQHRNLLMRWLRFLEGGQSVYWNDILRICFFFFFNGMTT